MPSAQGDVIRATAELVSRLGEVASGLRYEETDCVCSAGTIHAGTAVNVVPTSARVTGTLRTFTEAQHEEALVRLQDLCDQRRRRPGRPCGAGAARAHPGRGQRRRGDRAGGGRGERRARTRPGLPHAAGLARATTSASSCATCPAATSSSAAERRTARAGRTTAPPSSSRTSRSGSGPASWSAARWHWPRREPNGHNGRDDRLRPLRHRGEDGPGHRRQPRHRQDDRRGLRGRRGEGLHLLAQGGRLRGGGRRAVAEGDLHRCSRRPLHRGRVPASGRRDGERGRTRSTSW